MNWTILIDAAGTSGPQNMLLDYALLRAAQGGSAFLRFYTWDPACLSFGRNEAVLSNYDVDKIKAMAIDTVRRPTGGRAVWHETEVTYAIAAPLNLFGGLRETYLTVHEMFREALTGMGVRCELAAARSVPDTKAGPCFATPVGGEIVAAGRKLMGSAQLREGNAFLQHGSLLLDDCQDVISDVILDGAPPPQATSLNQCLGRAVEFDEVVKTIVAFVEANWDGDCVLGDAPPIPEASPDFWDPAWTWRR